MGLFNVFKKFAVNKKQTIDLKPLAWYFTEEAKQEWERIVALHLDEMINEWNNNRNGLIGSIDAYMVKGWLNKEEARAAKEREEWPCMFLKRYFMALGCDKDYISELVCFVSNMSVEGEDITDPIPYPDLLKAEKNPLINIAEKAQKADFYFSHAIFHIAIRYAYNAFGFGLDVSEESWLYEESTHKGEEGWTLSIVEIDEALEKARRLAKYKGYLPKQAHSEY